MSNSNYLLDSNAAIAVLNGDANLIDRLGQPGARFSLSIVVLSELLFGAEKSARREQNRQRVEDLASSFPLLNCDRATAEVCARLRNELRLKGKPIPHNDVWIAASSIQHNLTLVTRDAHFGNLSELQSTGW